MKTFSKKGVVLFAGVMAVCALAMPAMASALVWGPVGTEHTIHSTNLAFTAHTASGSVGSICGQSVFTTDVANPASTNLRITSATFAKCMGKDVAVNCTTTATAAKFPWTATGTSLTGVVIDGVHVSVSFENTPGNAAQCAVLGLTATLTGNLTGGSWVAATHTLELDNESGLRSHAGGALSAVTVTGTITDAAQTLTLS